MENEVRGFGVKDTDEAPTQIVFHIDMDCFYASCERLREETLQDEPVVIGMGYDENSTSGAVATASYEAREFGVESAMAISDALNELPRRANIESDPALTEENTGYYRPVDLEFYKSVASDVKAILHEHADVVRGVSIDEAYLDVTDRTDWAEAESYAREIKRRIEDEVGVVASVGVAPNMSAAKIASDYEKPDGLVVVEPGNVREFLAPLPVRELHGVGSVTQQTLIDEGIETAADIAAAEKKQLVELFGKRGEELFVRARGEDTREVEPMGLPKSLSKESAIETTAEMQTKKDVVSRLSKKVAERVQTEECLFQTVGIKVVEPPFEVNTRAKSLSGPVDSVDLIEEIAIELLEEFDEESVRKLGVRVSKLSFENVDQAELGEWPTTDTVDRPQKNRRDRGQQHLDEFE